MIRSGFSFKTAVGHMAEVVSRVKEIGWSVLPLTDRASTFGYVPLVKACRAAGLRPVFGVELAVSPDPFAKRPIVDHWRFLAKEHLRPIHDLIHLAGLNPGREPCLSYRQALTATGVFKIAGPRCLVDNVSQTDDFFVGLSPATPVGLYRLAKAKGLRLVACSDNYYPRLGDRELYRVVIKEASVQTYPQHIVDDDEWRRSVGWHADAADQDLAIANRDAIFDGCRAVLKKATLFSPARVKTLSQMCVEGANRIGVDLNDQVYSERLGRELRLIEEKDFSDYFYILADIMQWARARMVCGPARGSSCGSLVCYLLEITTIDPIPHDLVFERFIDSTRADLPDIDVDFSDKNRHLVFEEMERRYGKDRIARLGNVNTFQPRSAMNVVAAALKVPSGMVSDVANVTIKRSQGDSRASSTIEDTLLATDAGKRMLERYPEMIMVARLEDHPANAGQHAAGVVLTHEPIRDIVAVDARTGASMCDKYDAETLNLLKIDALGLTQLSTFERVLELLNKKPVGGWLEKIPLDDQVALDVLNKGHYAGIFQFTGASALANLTTDLAGFIDSFEDIVSLTALVRPGPLTSGGTTSWMRRKMGREPVTYFHPIFEPYLRDTFGIAVYQETVMRIGREVGDLSWADVNDLRRAMSKSLGKEFFDKYGDRWKTASLAKGVSVDAVDKMWDHMCTFGAMGFNRAHAVAYATVSYWSCWLKAHHPVEFAAASLDAESDPVKQIALLRELKREGVDYVPIDAAKSTDRWEIAEREGKKILVGPLTSVKGIGPNKMREVIEARKNGTAVKPALATLMATAKTPIDSLSPIADAVARIDLTAAKIYTPPTPISKVACGGGAEVVVIGVLAGAHPKDMNAPVSVARRGGKVLTGPTQAINVTIRDDEDLILCHVNRFDYETIGKEILERGGVGKSLYAIKGTVPREYRMISVKRVKYLGTMAV